MNLENLNLEELNAQEVQETEGGIWPIIAAVAAAITVTAAVGLLAGEAYYYYTNPKP